MRAVYRFYRGESSLIRYFDHELLYFRRLINRRFLFVGKRTAAALQWAYIGQCEYFYYSSFSFFFLSFRVACSCVLVPRQLLSCFSHLWWVSGKGMGGGCCNLCHSICHGGCHNWLPRSLRGHLAHWAFLNPSYHCRLQSHPQKEIFLHLPTHDISFVDL